MKMSLLLWGVVCAALVGAEAVAQTAPGLPLTRLAVQALSVLPASPARERLESLAMLETQRVK